MKNEIILKSMSKWVDHALKCKQMLQNGFDSAHIDELLNLVEVDQQSQIDYAKQAFKTLIELTLPFTEDYKPVLILSAEDTDEMVFIDRDDIYSGAVSLVSPPELYLIRRVKELEPYIVEEYKVPIESDIHVSEGFVYSYFSSQRRPGESEFSPAIFYEYYPKKTGLT